MTKIKALLAKYGLGLGIILSIGYAALAIFFLWHNQKYGNHLKLSEVGDYLSGAFSPLAFLWLVIGYLMQERQIRENTKSTQKNQEFSNKQFKYLITKEQNDVQPLFYSEMDYIDEKRRMFKIKVNIRGESIFNVTVDFSEKNILVMANNTDVLSEDDTFLFNIFFLSDDFNTQDYIDEKRKQYLSTQYYMDYLDDDLDTRVLDFIPIPIESINLNYMDRLGIKHRNKCTFYYIFDKYKFLISQSIKPQEDF